MNNFNLIKKIIFSALIVYAFLLLIIWLTPLAFSACAPNSYFCKLAYYITESGGPIGTLILVLLTGLFYTFEYTGFASKIKVFVKSLIGLITVFAVFAVINENFTKSLFKSHRPSHEFILKQQGLSAKLDSVYLLSKPKRSAYFATIIQNKPLNYIQIDPLILKHWVSESGYSFPSGHASNAFLLAMILAYGIYYNLTWKRFYFLPFVWAFCVAVSRVLIGVHNPIDVCTGAALGIVAGYLLLYFDFTRQWLTCKK